MGYSGYLRQLLNPLGVYDLRSGSFAGAELDVLGQEMDKLYAYAEKLQQESLALTAEAEGLEKMEALWGR